MTTKNKYSKKHIKKMKKHNKAAKKQCDECKEMYRYLVMYKDRFVCKRCHRHLVPYFGNNSYNYLPNIKKVKRWLTNR